MVLDEPSLHRERRSKNIARGSTEAFEEAEDPLAEPPDRYILSEEEWSLALRTLPAPRDRASWSLRSKALRRSRLQTQPTTRYHGNVAAFMARSAADGLATGEHVMVSAASTGELERFADICHEYELPYRLGELEENVTVTRLAEEGSSGNAPAMVLVKAPLAEGVVFPEAQLAIYGNGRSFRDACAARSGRARARRRPVSSAISRT